MIAYAKDLTSEQALGVMRIFSIALNLINSAEVAHRLRVTRVGNQGAGEPGGGKKDLDTAAEQGDGKDAYAARLLARVSTCNHSCRPNAAVSVSDDLVTLYSLRHIERGEEITVSYGKFIFILVRAISVTSCFSFVQERRSCGCR